MCKAAHQRLLRTVAGIDDDVVRQPSGLPGWSVGHVLTHLARNADGHTRRLDAALHGEEVPRYPGGFEQRDGEIDSGASRPAAEIVSDVRESSVRLEETWDRSTAAGWPNAELLAGDHFPTSGSPLRRLREVEMHHVDLRLGYGIESWPDDYVAWELPETLKRLPQRIRTTAAAKALLAWLTGRGGVPRELDLDPWL